MNATPGASDHRDAVELAARRADVLEIKRLREENERLRGALRYYADERHYDSPFPSPNRAQATLKHLEVVHMDPGVPPPQ